MNIKDLQNIDIKDLQNIDWRQIKVQLQSRPDLLINTLLVIVTLIALLFSFTKYNETAGSSKAEMRKLKKRLVAVEKLEEVRKRHDDFLKEIPKAIAGDQLIQTLSEFAIKRDVQIVSFSPAKEKSNKLVRLTSVKVNIASKNYASIILFVNDIEESSYPIRIESISGSSLAPGETLSRGSRRSSRQFTPVTDTQGDYIKATITIESVEMKNV